MSGTIRTITVLVNYVKNLLSSDQDEDRTCHTDCSKLLFVSPFLSQRSIPLICFHNYVTAEYICVVFNSCVFLDAVRT